MAFIEKILETFEQLKEENSTDKPEWEPKIGPLRNGTIFRNSRTEDFDQELLLKAILLILGMLIFISIPITPLVMFFSGGSMVYYLIEIISLWWIGSLAFTVHYDVMRDRKYFFADFPVYESWNFVLFLGLVPAGLPFILISQYRMKKRRESYRQTDGDIWNQQERLVSALQDQTASDEDSAERLKDYYLALWHSHNEAERAYLVDRINESRKELETCEAKQNELAEQATKLQGNLQDLEQMLTRLPEDTEPSNKTIRQAENCYRKILELPEVVQVQPEEGSLKIMLHFTDDDRRCELGYCIIRFVDQRDVDTEEQANPVIKVICQHLHSGLTTQGILEYPELDGQAFLTNVMKASDVEDLTKKGRLDAAIERFIGVYYWQKLVNIPRDQMSYTFLELSVPERPVVNSQETTDESH